MEISSRALGENGFRAPPADCAAVESQGAAAVSSSQASLTQLHFSMELNSCQNLNNRNTFHKFPTFPLQTQFGLQIQNPD